MRRVRRYDNDAALFTSRCSSPTVMVPQRSGLPAYVIQHFEGATDDYQHGVMAGMNDNVERLTGQKPMSVGEFARAHLDQLVSVCHLSSACQYLRNEQKGYSAGCKACSALGFRFESSRDRAKRPGCMATRNASAYSAGRKVSVRTVAAISAPIMASAIGAQKTSRASGIRARTA